MAILLILFSSVIQHLAQRGAIEVEETRLGRDTDYGPLHYMIATCIALGRDQILLAKRNHYFTSCGIWRSRTFTWVSSVQVWRQSNRPSQDSQRPQCDGRCLISDLLRWDVGLLSIFMAFEASRRPYQELLGCL